MWVVQCLINETGTNNAILLRKGQKREAEDKERWSGGGGKTKRGGVQEK
jgi:hypothetical protein